IVNGGSVMQCGFSELEAAMNTMTIEGWNYTGIGVPAPDTVGIAATNNLASAEQQHLGNVAETVGLMAVQKAQDQKPAYDPSKTGPEDPTNPGKPLYQNPIVKKASDDAFTNTTKIGTARNGQAEAGFSIDYIEGKIVITHQVDSVNSTNYADEVPLTIDPHTIAVEHTHGNSRSETPSDADRKNFPVPNFVRSLRALYVTVPATQTYIKLPSH
ncbi:MAG: hypothetical protein ACLQMT_09775, partial [Candidatus Acidiferrales bacterium]